MTKFDELAGRLAKKKGVTDPKALAAEIGRDKLGKKKFQAKAAAGRRKKRHPNEDLARQYARKLK